MTTPGAPPLGVTGLPAAEGVVREFETVASVGMIATDATVSEDDVLLHITAIPGQGYRTIRPSGRVGFEVVENASSPSARTIQPVG
jgi:cold shock CspA family protein